MANEMKQEFEAYVEQLASTIAKEIFLEDLKAVCEEYKKELDSCEKMYLKHSNLDESVLERVEKSGEELQSIRAEVEEKLVAITDHMEHFKSDYDQIMDKYETKVLGLNEELRKKFIGEFSELGQQISDEMKEKLQSENKVLSTLLKDAVSKKEIEKLVGTISDNTATINKSLQMIDSGYTEVFNKYADKVEEHNDREKALFREFASNLINDGMSGVNERLDASIEKQRNMLNEKMVDKDTVNRMGKQMSKMAERIKAMEVAYDNKLNRMVVLIEKLEKVRQREEAERRQERKVLYYLTLMNSAAFMLILLLVVYRKPWEQDEFGMAITGGCAGIIVLSSLLGFVIMNWSSKSNAKKRLKAKEEFNREAKETKASSKIGVTSKETIANTKEVKKTAESKKTENIVADMENATQTKKK